MIKLDNKKWISDQITVADMMGWKMGDIITIEAGTGTGKSEFIKNDLYAKAKVEGRKILFLVHRINCYEQFEDDIKGKEDVIKLTMYQTIDKVYNEGGKFDFSPYDYIVSDEFHYFTADAGFNNKTHYSLEAILGEVNKTRIFMSATANLVRGYLKGIRKYDLISYVAELDFPHIEKLHFYKNDFTEENILKRIVDSGEKAIVFVNNLDRLKELYLMYRNISLFNCSESAKEFRYVDEGKITEMLENKRFDDQLVFTTSVMDTGISIKDEEVKHIICNNILDANVLIQCIGRKRMESEIDKVNIYIKDVNGMALSGYLKSTRDKLDKVEYLEDNGEGAYTQKFGKEFDNKEILYDEIKDGKRVVAKNDMAYFKAWEDEITYKSMMDKGYKKYISDLFKVEYIDIDVEIEKESLTDYLDTIVGVRLYDKESKDYFCEAVNLRNGRNNRLIKNFDTISEHIRTEFNSKYIAIKDTDNRRVLEDGSNNPYRGKVYYLILSQQ